MVVVDAAVAGDVDLSAHAARRPAYPLPVERRRHWRRRRWRRRSLRRRHGACHPWVELRPRSPHGAVTVHVKNAQHKTTSKLKAAQFRGDAYSMYPWGLGFSIFTERRHWAAASCVFFCCKRMALVGKRVASRIGGGWRSLGLAKGLPELAESCCSSLPRPGLVPPSSSSVTRVPPRVSLRRSISSTGVVAAIHAGAIAG